MKYVVKNKNEMKAIDAVVSLLPIEIKKSIIEARFDSGAVFCAVGKGFLNGKHGEIILPTCSKKKMVLFVEPKDSFTYSLFLKRSKLRIVLVFPFNISEVRTISFY